MLLELLIVGAALSAPISTYIHARSVSKKLSDLGQRHELQVKSLENTVADSFSELGRKHSVKLEEVVSSASRGFSKTIDQVQSLGGRLSGQLHDTAEELKHHSTTHVNDQLTHQLGQGRAFCSVCSLKVARFITEDGKIKCMNCFNREQNTPKEPEEVTV